ERRVVDGLRALPGVAGAAASSSVPWGNNNSTRLAFPEGRELRTQDEIALDYRTATPGYLELMRISRVEGRSLASADSEGAPKVAVLSTVAARRLWPSASPLGKRVRLSRKADAPWLTVVGVVADVRDRQDDLEPRGAVYVPFEQAPAS